MGYIKVSQERELIYESKGLANVVVYSYADWVGYLVECYFLEKKKNVVLLNLIETEY